MNIQNSSLDEQITNAVGNLTESWGSVVDPSEVIRDNSDFFGTSVYSVYSQLYDRAKGRFRPTYENEMDLNRIRWFSWVISSTVPMAEAWRRRLTDYTIGTGFEWTITEVEGGNTQYAAAAKRWVDRVFENSDWSSVLERESLDREMEDGEFIATIEKSEGSVAIIASEAIELTEPAQPSDLERYLRIPAGDWDFGVYTCGRSRPAYYHFCRNEEGTDWDVLPESRVIHWKRNVRSGAKRGVSDFFRPQLYLSRAHKVLGSVADGAAITAAIAYIVQHAEGVSRQNVERMLSANLNLAGHRGESQRVMESKRGRSSAVRVDVPYGMEYKNGLLGANASTIYIDVIESCLRLAGTVHAFPEGMLTGSYENNNLASAIVAEGPFMQGRLAEQASRARQMRVMMEKIIRIGIKLGVFSAYGVGPEMCDAMDIGLLIEAIPAKVIQRDMLEHTQALKMQVEAGFCSQKTAISELGRDAATEEANGLVISKPESEVQADAGGVPAGEPAPTGNVATDPSGGWMKSNQREVSRYNKILGDVEQQLVSRLMTPTRARIVLKNLGVANDDIELMIQDARDGKIDSPIKRQQESIARKKRRSAKRRRSLDLIESARQSIMKELREIRKTPVAKLVEGYDPMQPRAKNGKWIYTGVDTSIWSKTNSAASWGIKKIDAMKKMAANGEWDKLKGFYDAPEGKKLNQYQKGVMKAKETLLALMEQEHDEAPKNAIPVPGSPALAGWKKVGESLGTEKGGTYIGPDGDKYYVKTPDNPDRALNEILAVRLYELAAGNVIDAQLVMVDGKESVATKWADQAQKIDWKNDIETKRKAQEDFAVHAWLANWDAIGAGSENPMDNVKLIDGKPILIDAGGSLEFKGMGGAGKKPFSETVGEWDTLRDSSINPSCAAVFGDMTPKQLYDAADKVLRVKKEEIVAMVEKYHPGDSAEKQAMVDKLLSRQKSIAERKESLNAKYGFEKILQRDADLAGDSKPDSEPKVTATPAQSSVKEIPAGIPEKPVVTSKANASAQKKFDALHAAAMSGDIEAVKAIPTNAESSQTYTKKHHQYKQAILAAMEAGVVPADTQWAAVNVEFKEKPSRQVTKDDLDLLSQLGVSTEPDKASKQLEAVKSEKKTGPLKANAHLFELSEAAKKAGYTQPEAEVKFFSPIKLSEAVDIMKMNYPNHPDGSSEKAIFVTKAAKLVAMAGNGNVEGLVQNEDVDMKWLKSDLLKAMASAGELHGVVNDNTKYGTYGVDIKEINKLPVWASLDVKSDAFNEVQKLSKLAQHGKFEEVVSLPVSADESQALKDYYVASLYGKTAIITDNAELLKSGISPLKTKVVEPSKSKLLDSSFITNSPHITAKKNPAIHAMVAQDASDIAVMFEHGNYEGIVEFTPKMSGGEAIKSEALAKLKELGYSKTALDIPNTVSSIQLKAADIKPAAVEKIGYWEVKGVTSDVSHQPLNWISNHTSFNNELYASVASKLSKQQVDALSSYTTSNHSDMNDYLRFGVDSTQKTKAEVEHIKTAFKHAPKVPAGIALSRNYTVSGSQHELFQPGQIVSDKGFLSTSTKKDVFSGGVRFNITVGEGVKGMPIDGISHHKGEAEILLPPGQRLLITNVVDEGYYSKSIYAVALPNEEEIEAL